MWHTQSEFMNADMKAYPTINFGKNSVTSDEKVDAVETKVLFMFGTVTAISIAITVFELLTP